MTALPALFFQLPRIHIRSEKFPFAGATLSSLINKEFGEKEKEENQLCIIDAFLPYGYAVMKSAFNSRTKKVKLPKVITGEQKSDSSSSSVETEAEYIDQKGTIALRQSPKCTYLDSTQPFGRGTRVTFQYERTLEQLKRSNLYNLSQNFIAHFGTKDHDARKVKIKIYEMFVMRKDKAWKLVWADNWNEELAWVKTEYRKLPPL